MTIEGETTPARAAVHACSPPRTRSSTRAPIRCPKRSSTGSCCACPSAIPSRARRMADARGPCRAWAGRARPHAARRPRHAARDAGAHASRSTSRSRSASTWSTSSPRLASSQSIQVGASPRGSLALLKLSRCRAALDGRDYVTPDDVKSVAVPALAHRLTLRPELWVQRVSAEDVVRERLDTVPTPAAEDLART